MSRPPRLALQKIKSRPGKPAARAGQPRGHQERAERVKEGVYDQIIDQKCHSCPKGFLDVPENSFDNYFSSASIFHNKLS